MSSYQNQSSKPRTKVAPILRKLAPSEKNSLDLDRPASEQSSAGIYHYNSNPLGSHDMITHDHGRRGYHQRSTSGTSQFSTGTAGSFVHPFQQTPRPYTPPLASAASREYANSLLREGEYSPVEALIEDNNDNNGNPLRQNIRSNSNLSNRSSSLTQISSSMGGQPLRIQTKQSASRLGLATSHSSSLQHINTTSPLFTTTADIASPADTMSPLAQTVRSSSDKSNPFRLRTRSRSDAERETPREHNRPLTIQEARRQFQEKEQAKEERAAREEIRALEKRNAREARAREKAQGGGAVAFGGGNGHAHAHRRSSASAETTKSKKERGRSKSDLTMRTATTTTASGVDEKSEPLGFLGRGYESVPEQMPPVYGAGGADGEMGGVGRSQSGLKSTKKKTHGAWVRLVMWLRTRIIRMGRRD